MAVDGVLNVFLFGSLARKVRYPGDIDILIFDDGRYSSDIEENEDLLYEDTMRLTLECIKLLNLREATLKAAAKCRWVDMLLINGDRLQSDSGYRSRISGRQIDSNFFLNISNDLEEYSTTSNSFVETNVPLFRKLKRIAESLDALGFPPRSIRHDN
jgi:predicted nucleotidyltransferase